MKIVLPILVLAVALAGSWWLNHNPPEAAARRPKPAPVVSVQTKTLQAIDYRVPVQSYGKVRPRTQIQLLSRVAGEVLEIGANFREGAFFDKGDLLLRLDPSDYEVALQRARANLIQAEQALIQERAQAQQAKEDWLRLGKRGQPSALVLRVPQQKAAEASIAAAKADWQRAKLDLDRTRITAPYAGRVLSKHVDVGQSVGSSTVLAELFATDVLEVRLPLKNSDLAFLELPERFRHQSEAPNLPAVQLTSTLVGEHTWPARVVRTEGALDSSSQQLYVIAQIDDPYGPAYDDRPPLKIGQYVTARIEGKPLPQVLAIPNSAIYQGSYVYVVEGETLQRRDIRIAWQGDEIALVSDGLQAGDALVTTLLGQIISGTRVKVAGAARAPNKGQGSGAAVEVPSS